ncbi:MAG: tetratricopeptide repeat protein [Deltaproteobacteria bacterium]|nr:tetratricopeptide repeat protein [Deltaproteobacteria bacterium]
METPSRSTWLTRSAIIISDVDGVHRMYSQLTQRFHWTVTETTKSLSYAVDQTRKGAANLIIVDDSVTSPSGFHVRALLNEITAICTPILCLLLPQRSSEAPLLTKMGFEVAIKPVTPAAFLPHFSDLLQRWEKPSFATLRRLGYLLNRVTDEQLNGALLKLMEQEAIHSLCVQSLALQLRKAGNFRDAEQTILASIKKDPRQDARIMSLVDLYLHGSMPKLALHLLTTLKTAHGTSRLLVPDYVQAALMLGQLNAALIYLETIAKSESADPMSIDFYARLLFASGRDDEAEQLLTHSGRSFKKFQLKWLNADSSGLPAAG